MAIQSGEKRLPNHEKEPSGPPGNIKVADALKTLLKEKNYNSITSTEIPNTSRIKEALIYRYNKDNIRSLQLR